MLPNMMPPVRPVAHPSVLPVSPEGSDPRRSWHLPFLCTGWALHLAAQNPDDEFLHLRLRLLCQPCFKQCPQGALYRRGNCGTDTGFLSAELHRGSVLSSGILRSPDRTMEDMVRVAKSLRQDHSFRGYIHLKTIPMHRPCWFRRRASTPIVCPSTLSFRRPRRLDNLRRKGRARDQEKPWLISRHIFRSLGKDTRHAASETFFTCGAEHAKIVGADHRMTKPILERAANLYSSYSLKRVYYSAFSPIPDSSRVLPLIRPP